MKLQIFSKFSRRVASPLACVQLISFFLYERTTFSCRMQSKYALNCINYDMFSTKITRNYNYPHSKRVAIIIILYIKIYYFFKIQSDQNIHQNAPNCTIFSKFSRAGYAPGPLAYMSANKL